MNATRSLLAARRLHWLVGTDLDVPAQRYWQNAFASIEFLVNSNWMQNNNQSPPSSIHIHNSLQWNFSYEYLKRKLCIPYYAQSLPS